MANTILSKISTSIISKAPWYMHGQFPNYGTALNYCIKENIDIKKINPIYSLTNKIQFYAIKGLAPIYKGGFITYFKE